MISSPATPHPATTPAAANTPATLAPLRPPAPVGHATDVEGDVGTRVETDVRHATTLADLCAVFERSIQVCVHPRPQNPALAEAVRELGASRWSGLRASVAIGPAGPRGLSGLALPEVAGRSALLYELTFLIEVYGDLLGCPAVGLRIERLTRAMCPLWHVDRTGIRLLCTLSGPGTQWLDDPGLDRACLPQEAMHRDPSGQAGPWDIVLLKGSAWQGNHGLGAIHRSPPVTAEDGARWLIALDALWSDA